MYVYRVIGLCMTSEHQRGNTMATYTVNVYLYRDFTAHQINEPFVSNHS